MIKQFDIMMGGRKLARSPETLPVTAKVISFPAQAVLAPSDANRFTQADGALQNCDRPFDF